VANLANLGFKARVWGRNPDTSSPSGIQHSIARNARTLAHREEAKLARLAAWLELAQLIVTHQHPDVSHFVPPRKWITEPIVAPS
jgi:hypothetical protein